MLPSKPRSRTHTVVERPDPRARVWLVRDEFHAAARFTASAILT